LSFVPAIADRLRSRDHGPTWPFRSTAEAAIGAATPCAHPFSTLKGTAQPRRGEGPRGTVTASPSTVLCFDAEDGMSVRLVLTAAAAWRGSEVLAAKKAVSGGWFEASGRVKLADGAATLLLLNAVLRPFLSEWGAALARRERDRPEPWDRRGELRRELVALDTNLVNAAEAFEALLGVQPAGLLLLGEREDG
jgi:hypothetical protein